MKTTSPPFSHGFFVRWCEGAGTQGTHSRSRRLVAVLLFLTTLIYPTNMVADTPHHTNRLAGEKSPYLLQHAHNPVDWYPWGEEALAKARAENKPIFLSIGYATCHWCHVMERESFENKEIAALLNHWFICIKVDREERPDLDAIYMAAVQAMTGSGGWPMTVFLTPDLKPFFGGTYFPPESRDGHLGMRDILPKINELWAKDPERIVEAARRMVAHLQEQATPPPGTRLPDAGAFQTYLQQMEQSFDHDHGGFGQGQKFPPAMDLSLLMRIQRNGDSEGIMAMVTSSLDAMMLGGLYDHVGGGFHRYTVDRSWKVPHFEKMLYTNALLVRTYLEAYQITGRQVYARVVRETCDYVLRDMTHPDGGFFSAEDADSEGEEGLFYLWTRSELEAALGKDEAELFAQAYDVQPGGNFEGGSSILHRVRDDADLARANRTTVEAVDKRLRAARKKLLEVRAQRVRPLRDDKVLTSWNGLMIAALAKAAEVLDEPRYRQAAVRGAEFILANLRGDQRLLRRWREGEAAIPAILTDYAFLVHGLLDLYEATIDLRWLTTAHALNAEMVARFGDPAGGFFDTDGSDSTLLIRNKDSYDGAIPTGNSIACLNLLRLAEYLDDDKLRILGKEALRAFHSPLTHTPHGSAQLLQALDFHLGTPKEIVIAGPPEDPRTHELLAVLRRSFLPEKVVALTNGDDEVAKTIPWANGRVAIAGIPTAYVCENHTCKLPVKEAAALRRQLD